MAVATFMGFVLLSGVKLFLTKKDTLPYKKWLVLRFKSIVVPYIFCFVIYYAFYYIVFDYPLKLVFISKQFLLGSLVCHLYFIPIIVQFDLLFPIWKKIINRCSPIIIIPFCLLVSQIFENYFPAMLGIINPRIKFAYNGIGSVSFINHVHFVYVWCVIMLIYLLSVKTAPYLMNRLKILKKIDAVSYDIYLWHMLILFLTDIALRKIGVVSVIYAFFIRIAVVYTVTIAGCIILKYLKRKLI